jgi:hypothetical protein
LYLVSTFRLDAGGTAVERFGKNIAVARVMARARVSSVEVFSIQRSIAALVVIHFLPTFRAGRVPEAERSYTVSTDTISIRAVVPTSSTSGSLGRTRRKGDFVLGLAGMVTSSLGSCS